MKKNNAYCIVCRRYAPFASEVIIQYYNLEKKTIGFFTKMRV